MLLCPKAVSLNLLWLVVKVGVVVLVDWGVAVKLKAHWSRVEHV